MKFKGMVNKIDQLGTISVVLLDLHSRESRRYCKYPTEIAPKTRKEGEIAHSREENQIKESLKQFDCF